MKGINKRDNLIHELLQGIEFVKEFRNQFMNNRPNASSLSSISDDVFIETPNFLLLDKLLSTFDKTISTAKLLHFQVNQDPSFNENSLPPSKRRRTMTVKIRNEGGGTAADPEGSLDDGFRWRKYGQKDILGSQFPREYYRCAERHSLNCVATKQVQRTDEDPTIYRIAYIGEHTCTQEAQLSQAQSNPNPPSQMKSQAQKQEVCVGLGPKYDIKVELEQEIHNRAHNFIKVQAQSQGSSTNIPW